MARIQRHQLCPERRPPPARGRRMSRTKPAAPDLRVRRWTAGAWSASPDAVVMEEPLQLLLDGEPLSVIMRTPGNDIELALGLLHAERVITSVDDVASLRISAEAHETEEKLAVRSDLIESNAVDVGLRSTAARRPRRSFLSSSA